MSLTTLTATYRAELGIASNISGVLVMSVENGSAADKAGLEAGNVITAIDKINISSIEDYAEIIENNEEEKILLDIVSSGKVDYAVLDLTDADTSDLPGSMPDSPGSMPDLPEQSTLGQRIMWLLTGGMPFGDDDEDEEEEGGYKGQPLELPPSGSYDPELEDVSVQSNVVLTEHIEEEDDYEKPVCKRLEEEGERYEDEDVVSGII